MIRLWFSPKCSLKVLFTMYKSIVSLDIHCLVYAFICYYFPAVGLMINYTTKHLSSSPSLLEAMSMIVVQIVSHPIITVIIKMSILPILVLFVNAREKWKRSYSSCAFVMISTSLRKLVKLNVMYIQYMHLLLFCLVSFFFKETLKFSDCRLGLQKVKWLKWDLQPLPY